MKFISELMQLGASENPKYDSKWFHNQLEELGFKALFTRFSADEFKGDIGDAFSDNGSEFQVVNLEQMYTLAKTYERGDGKRKLDKDLNKYAVLLAVIIFEMGKHGDKNIKVGYVKELATQFQADAVLKGLFNARIAQIMQAHRHSKPLPPIPPVAPVAADAGKDEKAVSTNNEEYFHPGEAPQLKFSESGRDSPLIKFSEPVPSPRLANELGFVRVNNEGNIEPDERRVSVIDLGTSAAAASVSAVTLAPLNVVTPSASTIIPVLLSAVTPASVSAVTPVAVSEVTPASVGTVTLAPLNVVTPSASTIIPAPLSEVTPAAVSTVTPASVSTVTLAPLNVVTPSASTIIPAPLSEVTPAAVSAVTPASVSEVTPAAVGTIVPSPKNVPTVEVASPLPSTEAQAKLATNKQVAPLDLAAAMVSSKDSASLLPPSSAANTVLAQQTKDAKSLSLSAFESGKEPEMAKGNVATVSSNSSSLSEGTTKAKTEDQSTVAAANQQQTKEEKVGFFRKLGRGIVWVLDKIKSAIIFVAKGLWSILTFPVTKYNEWKNKKAEAPLKVEAGKEGPKSTTEQVITADAKIKQDVQAKAENDAKAQADLTKKPNQAAPAATSEKDEKQALVVLAPVVVVDAAKKPEPVPVVAAPKP